MNLVPHGILLQVTVWLINFQHGFRLCSGGEPGYLDFDNLPETNFSCVGKVIGGYYADVETGCQMFHVCTIGQKDEIMDIKFLCLNGTVFDQETRVCERVDEVDCSKSERFYNLNLELYGNNAVTLSLHEVPDDEGEQTESIDEQHSTTVHPTTSTTTTTTQRPTNPPSTATTTVYHQNTGYSPHYQTQPLYSTPQTSQSKSLYDEKNSGYHHQYIFHNGEQANNQATSFQLFSNQGVSSTTNQPQVHQARYGTTSSPQIILNSPSTVSPLFHGVSSTIQTLLNSNANNPSFINPLFHNHGTPSTTEHFSVHSNNPRETQEYHEDGGQSEERSRRPLEAVQSTNQGSVSKLSISPVPESDDDEDSRDSDESDEEPTSSSQGLKISTGFLPTPTTPEPTARSFYPTPRTSPRPDSGQTQITRHIHLSPAPTIPQLKPQQITINLPPPDIQRIVQSPSPLLPSQSRVIVTAKASVSDESGRPLNTSELVVLPLPTIPASYDDYKEGDESFDPFYRDVPKIRRARSPSHGRGLGEGVEKVHGMNRRRQALRRLKRAISEDQGDYEDDEDLAQDYEYPTTDDSIEDEDARPLFTDSEEAMDIATIKANFKKFKALLLGRGTSREISRERKISKERISNAKSTTSYNKVQNPEDDGARHREGKTIMLDEQNDAEDLTDDHESKGDENSGDSNIGDSVNSELMSMMKTSGMDEKGDDKSVTAAKETDAEEHSEAEPPSDVQKTADQSDPIAVESDMKQSDQSESTSDDEKSVDKLAEKMQDAEKAMEPVEHANSEDTSRVDDSTTEETVKPKAAETTRESDAEEYIEPSSVLNTKESDLGEDVDPKSAPTTKEADIEKPLEPKINAKESDSKEYIKPEPPITIEEPNSHKDAEGSEKTVPVLNTQKSVDAEVSKDSDNHENVENKEVSIPNDEVAAEITLETKPTGDTEETISEVKITEVTDGKVELEPEAKINQPNQEAHQESINTPSNKEGSISEDNVKSEMTADVGELKEEKITEPKAEKTDALVDVEEAKEEKAELSTKEQVSKTEENHQVETVSSKHEEDLKSNADVDAKDIDVGEHAESQPEQPDVTSEVPQEAEKSVITDDMKLHQVAGDQKPEVKEKLTDHATGKKQDSLDEKVGSTPEKKDSALEEKSEKTIKSEEIKELKLSQPREEKSNLTPSSGWKPSKAKTSTTVSPNLENTAATEQPREPSEEVDTKTKTQNGGTKSSKNTNADGEYSNDAELPEIVKEKQDGYPRKGDDRSGERSSESPNKVPDGALDCGDAVRQSEESTYEDSRAEYDDYPSDEYISGSRESEPYERTDEEFDSQEATSEYTDSGYDSGNEYSTSVEDYLPISNEEYSTEDSRPTTSSEDYSTEGVLKFTDEIPQPKKKHLKQKNRVATRAKVSSEDYVDDNYEPEHYRENSKEKHKNPVGKEQKVDHQSSGEGKLNDEAADGNSTTTTTTTEAPTTTTTTRTTTTARPTPPSLFRPFSIRKNYKYIPPTTTPNPVVIKHRFGLLNPRPAKPIKSYNDLAPRPVIRKSPLLARKPYGTESTTEKVASAQRRIDDFEDSDIIFTSTEYMDEDEKPRENKLTRSANDVSFNETNESSESDEDALVNVEETLSNDSTAQSNTDTSPDSTEKTPSNTPAYLSTPYPLLRATTSGNLFKLQDEVVSQTDPPTSESPKTTQVEESSEISTSSSPTAEVTTASAMADDESLKVDRGEEEEEEEEENPKVPVPVAPFSCIDKEPYRFYGDPRDCRLFHYCSPGFTAKQMLDFRFVCENTTMFDEKSQSCKYDIENSKCANRQW